MLLTLLACAPTADRVETLSIGEVTGSVSPEFLSFAVDSGQVAGTVFWSEDPTATEPEVGIAPYDFTRPALGLLAAELSPAWLRIGGTDADRLYYDLGEGLSEPPDGYRGTLTEAQLQGAVDFAEAAGLQLFFTLNAGPSSRDEAGEWQPDNAQALLQWTAERQAPIGLWELGNELNGYALLHGESVSPETYGRDLQTLASLRDAHTPDALVAGPSSAYWPVNGEFLGFMEDALSQGGEHLDVVTWHYYPQQSERCPLQSRLATPETMLATDALDEGQLWADQVEGHRDDSAPHAQVWLGETGNAQCGGQPGVSDAFASSFWWLDQLGWLAQREQPVVIRQTLSGADYALIDESTLEPNPDYWVSVLHKRLMGPQVLQISGGGPLRVYAHCDAENTTLAVINPSDESVLLDLGRQELWLLQADDLADRQITLNGEPLSAPDGVLPPLEPVIDHPLFPSRSLGFVRLEGGCP